ncbi:hypothetical protein Dimus_035354 [Dionaea muscipula]
MGMLTYGRVNKPEATIALKRHDREVTAVDWNFHEQGKIVTASDDFTVCAWNIASSFYPPTRSPASIRRKAIAVPSSETKRLGLEMQKTGLEEVPCNSPGAAVRSMNMPGVTKMPEVRTPEPHKRISTSVHLIETFEKTTPEAESPSSVLYPPSSLKKKTIRDYFLSASRELQQAASTRQNVT